jgi:hypothetical protein
MKIIKHFIVPILTIVILFIIYELDFIPTLFEKVNIDRRIYRLLFPSR